MRFRIRYRDPETEGVKEVIKYFEDTETVSAELWAEDYAYALADKGWYDITPLDGESV